MKKFKERIDRLGLSYKKEVTICLLINLVLFGGLAALFLFTHKIPYLIYGAAFILVFNYVYLTRYKAMERELNQSNVIDFVSIFTYFKIYLNNGYNVYKSLELISKFANQDVKERFDVLQGEIDEDKSLQPFITFAKTFDNLLIEQLMISVYQMVDEGNNSSYLRQFEVLFTKLSDDLYTKEFQKQDKKLGSMTAYPLIGSATLILMITVGVINLIGDMIGGI